MSLIITQKKILSLLVLLLAYGLLVVHATPPQARSEQECVFLATEAKIYCYGGQTTDRNGVPAVLGQNFFSLSLRENTTIMDIQDAWEGINWDVGPNYYFAMTAIPNEGRIYIDGGSGAGDNGTTPSRYEAAIFNVNGSGGEWEELTSFRNGGRVTAHTATLGKDNNTIYVWGGYRGANTRITTGQPENSPEMFIFDIINSQWRTGNVAKRIYTFHTAVLVDSTIYYIGGKYIQPNGSIIPVEMSSIQTYDTSDGQWNFRTTTGTTPSTRMRHTATLKPQTKEIILFGGQAIGNNMDIRDDYFYVLNTDAMIWSTPTIGSDGDTFSSPGIRGHSAVLVENNLFIMFGATAEGTKIILRTRIWVMDVNRWTWIGSISAVSPQATPSVSMIPSGTELSADSNEKTNNAGTIAGAVVGAVAGVAIMASAIFFFIRRKRQGTRNTKEEHKMNNERMLPKEDDVPPPDEMRYSIDKNRQSISTNAPAFSQTINAGIVGHSVYTDNSKSQWDQPSGFHTTVSDKLGDITSPRQITQSEVQRLVLAPVKPDRA